MDISTVTQLVGGVNGQNYTPNSQPNALQEAAPTSETGTDFGSAGVFEPTSGTTQTFQPDMQRVSQMWNAQQERVSAFRQMVETLLGQQAERQGLAAGSPLSEIEITPEMRAEAQAMIDEGGYFSVEETAARLLDFAVALTGGDPAQIEVMRDAVQRGFAQAERMFGGELPEISHQTLAAAMEGFDQWAEGGVAAIALLNR